VSRHVAAPTASSRRAFTLIETIAALVVLSIAVPALLWTLGNAHIQRIDPMLVTTATWLAHEKAEDVLADASCPSRGYSWVLAARYPRETTLAGFPGFSRRVRVRETGIDLASAGTGCKIVTVEVTFRNAARRQRTLTLSTLVTEMAP
jgi:prepilin-type N-terminal cleavage/methylation domain-containing protein